MMLRFVNTYWVRIARKKTIDNWCTTEIDNAEIDYKNKFYTNEWWVLCNFSLFNSHSSVCKIKKNFAMIDIIKNLNYILPVYQLFEDSYRIPHWAWEKKNYSFEWKCTYILFKTCSNCHNKCYFIITKTEFVIGIQHLDMVTYETIISSWLSSHKSESVK